MKHYVIALGIYCALMLGLMIFNLLTNHYRNHGNKEKKTDAFNGREDNRQVPTTKGMYVQPSRIPDADEPGNGKVYEAYSIEEYDGDVYDMPFDLWIAKVEHDSFMEYMRMDLQSQGILMEDIER